MCALFLELPRAQVDVNVHPNKLEVRFQNEASVSAAVEQLVREAMRGESLGARLNQSAPLQPPEQRAGFSVVELPQEEPARPEPPEPEASAAPIKAQPSRTDSPRPKPVVPIAPAGGLSMHESLAPASVARVMARPPAGRFAAPWREERKPSPPAAPCPRHETLPQKPPKPEAPEEGAEQTVLEPVREMEQPLRLAGILFDTYWVFEAGDRVLLVDQHAAHERILYDRLMARFENERVSQKLLAPQLVNLTPYDMTLVSEFAPVLAEAGFDVAPFDSECVAIRAIPTFFGQNDSPKDLLLEALSEWQAGRGQVTRERLRRRVAQMACKHAIKGGDRLSDTEINGFLREMLKSESMPTCPHGRPIVVEVTRYSLEKRFKRVQ